MALGPISTPRRSAPRSIGTPMSVISIFILISARSVSEIGLPHPTCISQAVLTRKRAAAQYIPPSRRCPSHWDDALTGQRARTILSVPSASGNGGWLGYDRWGPRQERGWTTLTWRRRAGTTNSRQEQSQRRAGRAHPGNQDNPNDDRG